jgi:hypothetical protein
MQLKSRRVFKPDFNRAAKVRKKGSLTPFAYTIEKVVEVIDHVMTNKIEQS